MKNNKNHIADRLIINVSEIPLDSSLGLLAYGDIAFTAWRDVKKTSHKKEEDEKG